VSVKKPNIKEHENMEKIGVTATVAILIVALLITGVVSALTSNETQEKTILIRGIGPGITMMTSDGQIIRTKFYNITNETDIGSANETHEKYIWLKANGPDTLMTSDGQVVRVKTIVHKANETLNGTNGTDDNSGSQFLTTNWTGVHKYTIRVEPEFGENHKNEYEVIMIGSVNNSSPLIP
jgi:archaellum component FlaG (FlaF/FlaG flagellin family)